MLDALAVREPKPLLRWDYYDDRSRPTRTTQVDARVVLAKEDANFTFDKFLNDNDLLWDTGWGRYKDSRYVPYGGPQLDPGTRYIWLVRTRTAGTATTEWSASADFVTAREGWVGKWIQAPWSTERDGAELDASRPMPIFRRAIRITNQPLTAKLKIAGLGQWQVKIDGKPVSAGLDQAWTDYRKTVTYSDIDLSEAFGLPIAQAKKGQPRASPPLDGSSAGRFPNAPTPPVFFSGEHVISIMLGNGMYDVQRTKGRYTKFEGGLGPPKMIAELVLTFNDRHIEVIGTDEQWKVAPGPVTFSSIYGGEDNDARREPAGWDRAGFSDTTWSAASVVDGPGGTLVAALAPEIVQTQMYEISVPKVVAPNKLVYDAGQNIAGRPSILVRGPAGAVLKLTPGELLKPDGTVSQASSGGPMYWTYTLKGGGEEEWEPQFGYYGFRYLQAEWSGAAMPPARDGLQAAKIPIARIIEVDARQLSSASKVTGTFTSSNETLNAIHKLIVEAMHNNEMSIFTDCPHREKLGWDEETHLVASGLMFNNDLRGLYAATDRNIADAQHDDGDVPTIAPQYTKFGPKYPIYDDSPEWGSAAILAPWAAYRFYGDRGQLEQDYAVMQRYIAFLQGKAVDGIVAYGLGDWYDIGPGGPGFSKLTTLGVTGTLMLYEDAVVMEKIAGLLGKAEDAARYGKLAAMEKTAFNAKFFDRAKGVYDTGSQTAQAMPLALGVVPEDAKAKLLDYLVADIHAHQDHITTGEVGFPYLLRVLMENGRNDVLLAIMLRKDPPSYASQLEAGATALTEAWDANPKSSQDHFMLGGAEEWFYRGLGGIDFDMARAATDTRITIRPELVTGVDWVKCGYDSILGHVESDWRRGPNGTTLDVTVPNGAKATVVLPDGTQVVGSGVHHFTVKPRA